MFDVAFLKLSSFFVIMQEKTTHNIITILLNCVLQVTPMCTHWDTLVNTGLCLPKYHRLVELEEHRLQLVTTLLGYWVSTLCYIKTFDE